MQPDLVDRRRQALVDDAPVLEGDHLVTGREHVGQAVRHQHEGGALAPALDAIEEFGGLVVRKRAGRLVEQDDRLDRVDAAEGEGLGDLDELALPEWQAPGERRRADLDPKFTEHLPRLFDHRLLAQHAGNDEFLLAAEEDILEDRDGRDKTLFLEDRRDTVARRLGRGGRNERDRR